MAVRGEKQEMNGDAEFGIVFGNFGDVTAVCVSRKMELCLLRLSVAFSFEEGTLSILNDQ